ncbi:MAG TPA: NAD(P)/FAD-dependent oxidoreductase [Steroidobacteraceae bacterium]|nr:NAD(P)/FAD-dependent oxidoreductase [Steroidobacteraceae bacterium]
MIISRSSPPDRFDAVIIGGGHNGLTCACYLAKSGLSVGVFERRSILGGAAVTEEFHPGFRNSTASYTVSLLNPKIIQDLRLAEYGLQIIERPMQNFLPLPDGRALTAGPALADTLASVRQFSARDAERLPHYFKRLEAIVAILREQLLQTPPVSTRRLRDLWSTLQLGRQFRALAAEQQRDVHEFFTRSAGELLDSWFETDALKALYGFDAIVGNYASPYTPGTGYVLLHHVFGEVNGKTGVWGHAMGGMGSITQAMARAAEALGVHLELDTPVKTILIDRARARGIELDDGRTIAARAVAANVGPKILFLKLLPAAALPPEFRARIERFRMGSATFRMNVALSELPHFTAAPSDGSDTHLGAGIIMAPSLEYLDRAHAHARLEGYSREPVIEMLIPSTLDTTLAPPGAHVASLFCQHFAPQLPAGRSWHEERDAAASRILDTVDRYAPNFRASVLGQSALSPLDLEEKFALTGGDIFHGALSLDQLWAARPVLGYGDYRTPVQALYLCGAGAHPGGGVTGIPGHNAAREILRDSQRNSVRGSP